MARSRFILGAFDHEQWCQVLQSMLPATDPEPLREILSGAADGDPELRQDYILDENQLAAIDARFNVSLDVAQLASQDLTIFLFQLRRVDEVPYLVHGGYELPLLLEGRKKLARFSDTYPPMTFKGEERFDHWVAQGVLHREVVDEPFDPPYQTPHAQTWNGHRTVYYTPKGEEWRIPAMKLIWQAAGKSGGWNETFERLEGLLFGYEDWQNDWWINRAGGRFSGMWFCCAVTAAGLAWIESAGFRALPPIGHPTLGIMSYNPDTASDLCASLFEDPDHAAVVRFNVPGVDAGNSLDLRHGGPWDVEAARIVELNRFLQGSVVLVAKRDGAIKRDQRLSQGAKHGA